MSDLPYPPPYLPRTLTFAGVKEMYGWGRTKTYELLGQGRLEAVKIDDMTLILVDSCERLLASAPKAVIRTRLRRRAKS